MATYRITKDIADAMLSAIQKNEGSQTVVCGRGNEKQTIELTSPNWEFTRHGLFHIDYRSSPVKKQLVVIFDPDDPIDKNMKKAAAICFRELLQDNPGEWNDLLRRSHGGKKRKGRALLIEKLYAEEIRINNLDIVEIIGYVQKKANAARGVTQPSVSVQSRGSTADSLAVPHKVANAALVSVLKTEFAKFGGTLAHMEQRLAQPSESIDSRHTTSDADFTVNSMNWNLRDTSESVGSDNETDTLGPGRHSMADNQGSTTPTAASSPSPDTPDSLDSLWDVEFISRRRSHSF